PHEADNPMDTLLKVLQEEPPAPRGLRPDVPRDLEVICLKCLARQPERRYRSALELAEDLERWLAAEPIRGRPAGRWERLRLWARRRPAQAALAAVSAAATLALGAGLILGVVLLANKQRSTEEALERERDALEELGEVRQEERQAGYL